MKRSRMLGLALCGVALAAHAEAASAWDEVELRPQPGGMVATCLRETDASDRISVIGPRMGSAFSTQLLGAGSGGFAADEQLTLGRPSDCVQIDIAPSGGAVAAGLVQGRRRSRLAAAVRGPGGRFGAPVILGTTRVLPFETAVAASDRALVVAWVEVRANFRRIERFGPRARMRVLAARGSPSDGLGAPEALIPWHRTGGELSAAVAADVDPAGRITVAWARPLRVGRRGFASTYVEESTAEPGASFTEPRRVARLGDFFEPDLALASAPDGRSILAASDGDFLEVLERESGAARFQRRARFTGGFPGAHEPVVAVRSGGGALIGWRTSNTSPAEPDAGVTVVRREGPGPFGPRQQVVPPRTEDGVSETIVVYGEAGRPRPPSDTGNTGLRAALAEDGRALLTWISPRRAQHGDRPLAPTVATGTLSGGFERPRRLGSRCRAANAAVPLIGASGPLVAWTDNLSIAPAGPEEEEIPQRGGRLHLAAADRPAPANAAASHVSTAAGDPPLADAEGDRPASTGAAPRVRMTVPRGQRLRRRDPLLVRAHCDGPCDLRASVRRGRRGPATAVGTGQLARAGTATVRLIPAAFGRRLAGRDGVVSVTARACAPGGSDSNVVTKVARVTSLPVRRPPLPVNVSAIRRGRRLVVRWDTRVPARGVAFLVDARGPREGRSLLHRSPEYVPGDGRRHFRKVLRLRPGEAVDTVRITSERLVPPFPRRRVEVPVG